MWLTKHEKEVLKLLLDDGKISDTHIAERLQISTQAVGRIRKRLEEDVIKKYTVELDSKMLGINVIAIIKLKFNSLGIKELDEVEKGMIKELNTINILKLTNGEGNYVVVGGFKSLEELEEIIRLNRTTKPYDYEIKEIITMPTNHVLKDSRKDLHKKFIDACGQKHAEL